MSADPTMDSITITLETTTGAPGSFPVVLKKIMEIPPPNLLEGDDGESGCFPVLPGGRPRSIGELEEKPGVSGKRRNCKRNSEMNYNDKEKLRLRDDVDLGLGGGESEMGPSAALTPAIWDKTIPYDGETFHLEYMDLEEFLMENSIPASLDDGSEKEDAAEKKPEKKASSAGKAKHKMATPSRAPVSLLPILELDQCGEEVTLSFDSDMANNGEDKDRTSPEPIAPEEIEVEVNFEPDPTDLVLSSVPGGELFNPRKHKFSVEELKPQPMIKKAKKVLVPEEQKDEKYWQRRKKNNVAAKRSRDARRLKENQITVRAAFLERENTALRQEVAELRKDFGRCKNVLSRYEVKFGTLSPLEEE